MTNFIDARVAARRHLTEDVIELTLTRADGSALPAFSAGAHLDVEVAAGLLRQYSLCSAPAVGEHRIAIQREPSGRGGSIKAHERLQAGSVLRVSEPRNLFRLDEEAQRTLLVAGGIGITPMLSMALRLAALDRQFNLVYCARSTHRAAFVEELSGALWKDRVAMHFDDEPERGAFDAPSLLAHYLSPGAQLYVCGPTGFMDHVTASARAVGWQPSDIHTEYFTAPELVPNTQDREFTVKLAHSGQHFRVPVGTSIAQVLEDNGVPVSLSCEAGMCGSCVTGVVSGEPDHRDCVLTASERASNTKITVCCSRSKSDELVLDL